MTMTIEVKAIKVIAIEMHIDRYSDSRSSDLFTYFELNVTDASASSNITLKHTKLIKSNTNGNKK